MGKIQIFKISIAQGYPPAFPHPHQFSSSFFYHPSDFRSWSPFSKITLLLTFLFNLSHRRGRKKEDWKAIKDGMMIGKRRNVKWSIFSSWMWLTFLRFHFNLFSLSPFPSYLLLLLSVDAIDMILGYNKNFIILLIVSLTWYIYRNLTYTCSILNPSSKVWGRTAHSQRMIFFGMDGKSLNYIFFFLR